MHHGIVQGPFFVAAHNRTPTAAPLNGTTVPYLPKNSPKKMQRNYSALFGDSKGK